MALEIRSILTIEDIDKDGDVEIVMEDKGPQIRCYLNKSEVRLIIEFLIEQLEK